MLAVLAALFGVGCIRADLIDCGNGVACPNRRACDFAHQSCTSQEQLDACMGAAQNDLCATTALEDGVCREGVCLPRECGNAYVDPGERCDDGNEATGDGCRADCGSDERCGTGVIDAGEACDDGNLASHDGCDSNCRVETPVWSVMAQVSAGRSIGFAGAFDETRGQLIMFGSELYTSGTLIWDGHAWRVVRSVQTDPVPRTFSAMAYDARRHQIVMFGGFGASGELGDTWTWDGERWTEHLVVGPSARMEHAMAYDRARDRVVLFGGWTGLTPLGDVWEWDGTAWMQIARDSNPAPTPRSLHTAAYDPTRGQIVVYGGTDGVIDFDETWLWNGRWTEAARGPAAKVGAKMSYSPVVDAIVLTGTGDVWHWNGSAWDRDLTPTTRLNRTHHVSYFDPAAGTTVIFGGTAELDGGFHLWAYNERDAAGWTAIVSAPGPGPRLGPALAYDRNRARVVMFGGFGLTGPGAQVETWELVDATWRLRQPVTRPPPSFQVASAYDEGRGVTMLFATDAAVYEWTGEVWTKRIAVGPAPDTRNFTAMAYHRVRGVTVLFGGSQGSTLLDDTWLWDGTAWARASSGPAPRHLHRLVYDSARAKVVMFGGADSSGGSTEVWEWDGAWTRVTAVDDGPTPRCDFGMTYDSGLGETILHGGRPIGSNVTLRDTWTWNGTRWQLIAPSGNRPMGANDLVYVPSLGASILFNGNGSYRLRWQSEQGVNDVCRAALDLDEDGASGCDDPDCAFACSACGDSRCDALETPTMCPADC